MYGENNRENLPVHVVEWGCVCRENCFTSFPAYLLLSILMLPQQNKATMQFCSPHPQTLPTCTAAAATPWLSSAVAGSGNSAVSGLCLCLLWIQQAFANVLKYDWWEIPLKSIGCVCLKSITHTNGLPWDRHLLTNEIY